MEFFRDWGVFIEVACFWGWYMAAIFVWRLKTEPPGRKKTLSLIMTMLLLPFFFVMWFYFQLDKNWQNHPALWEFIYVNCLFFGMVFMSWVSYKTSRKGKNPAPRPLNLWLFRLTGPELRFWKARGATAAFLLPVALLLGIGYASWGAQPCGWFDRWTGYSGCLFELPADSTYSDLQFSPDGQLLSVPSENLSNHPVVRLYNTASGSPVRELKGFYNQVDRVAFSPNGQLVATAPDDQSILVWQVSDGKLLQTLSDVEHVSVFSYLQFSPDGKFLLGTNVEGFSHIWRVSDWQEVKDSPPQGELTFTPDGLALLSGAGSVQFYDPATWAEVKQIPLDPTGEPVESNPGQHSRAWVYGNPVFSPDGRLFAFWLRGKHEILVYNLLEGKLLYRLPSLGWRMAFSPDGRYLLNTQQKGLAEAASVAGPYWLQLWDLRTSKLLREFGYEKQEIRNLTFSPDGKIAWVGFGRIHVYKIL